MSEEAPSPSPSEGEPSPKPGVHEHHGLGHIFGEWGGRFAIVGLILAALPTTYYAIGVSEKVLKLGSEAFRHVWPSPKAAAPFPLSLTVSKTETRPFDGYRVLALEKFPTVYPTGAIVRLIMQATDSSQPVNVDRLALVVKQRDAGTVIAHNEGADPLAQPGFGAARPEVFYVSIYGETTGNAIYVRQTNDIAPASYPSLLPVDRSLTYHLDAVAGLQMAMDVVLKVQARGLYEVKFCATGIAGAREDVVCSEPLYIRGQ